MFRKHCSRKRLLERGGLLSAICRGALLSWLLAACIASNVYSYTLYGYEDEYGIVHLHEKPVTRHHKLLYKGEQKPRLGLQAIKRLIRERGAKAETQREDWIKQHVKAWKPKPFVNPQGRGAPSEQLLEAIKKTGKKYELDPNLLYAVMEQESGFRVKAVSPKGAQGLMQLMPGTQRLMGLDDPFDAAGNLDAGARYLKRLMKRFKNLGLALAAYNAGPGAVQRYNGVPPYAETRLYVQTVLARYNALRAQ